MGAALARAGEGRGARGAGAAKELGHGGERKEVKIIARDISPYLLGGSGRAEVALRGRYQGVISVTAPWAIARAHPLQSSHRAFGGMLASRFIGRFPSAGARSVSVRVTAEASASLSAPAAYRLMNANIELDVASDTSLRQVPLAAVVHGAWHGDQACILPWCRTIPSHPSIVRDRPPASGL